LPKKERKKLLQQIDTALDSLTRSGMDLQALKALADEIAEDAYRKFNYIFVVTRRDYNNDSNNNNNN